MTDDLTRLSAWDYRLPPELIARYPAERRDGSRLLVAPRSGPFEHRTFSELPEWFRAGDVLVLNESRVLPVRLLGRKPTGAEAEVLLLRLVEDSPSGDAGAVWEAMVRPGARLKAGAVVEVGPNLRVVLLEVLPNGHRIVRLESPLGVEAALEEVGKIPLPPYLDREEEPLDRERYQTVFARVPGSVAAPTAGLHFTPETLHALEARGVTVARIVLHVGPGTFRPVEAERITDHPMHAERWEIPPEAALAINRAREVGGRIWAVGTTVVRTLEAQAQALGLERGGGGSLEPGQGETQLFLHPGVPIRLVDGLLTNFHLPKSTLLMLVGAFLGHPRTLAAYEAAVDARYRFYSYGDAMLLPPPDPASGG
jgi:S-adenosylmethionine:tRNA ribosyltransferase-isomerase